MIFRYPYVWVVTILLLLFMTACGAQEDADLDVEQQDLEVELQKLAGGLDRPVDASDPGSGPERLYVCTQPGQIKILNLENNEFLSRPFLDIRSRTVVGYELGLLSLAFHPNFEENRKFYLNYNIEEGGNYYTIVSEWRANEDGTRAHMDSEQIVMRFRQPYQNHNGGKLAFGPDGYLYIATGDGGAANDPRNNGQNPGTLLGAILRIDVNGEGEGENGNYAIPSDNPFVDRSDARDEIFAYGLRNPWRFSFDRETDVLWAGDVGQSDREIIHIIEKGKNYGWRLLEGSIENPNIPVEEETSDLERPIVEYETGEQGDSVVGGYVYRGDQIPDLQGYYIYGDYSSGFIWAFQYEEGQVKNHSRFLESNGQISSFAEDRHGELYLVSLTNGIFQFVPESNGPESNGNE